VINRAGDLGPGLVGRHISVGADRVILAVPQAGPEVASLLVRFPRLHVIETRHEHRSAAEILRYLLHRFGHGHWCLVLGPDDHFICPGAKGQLLRDLCARLDDAGFDALKCNLLNGRHADREQDDNISCADTDGNRGPVRSIRTVALDELSGLVFVAQVDISEQAHAEDAGVRSKIALLRYRRGRGMAADLRAVDGYREADFSGTLLRSAASTVRPSPGQACSLAEPIP